MIMAGFAEAIHKMLIGGSFFRALVICVKRCMAIYGSFCRVMVILTFVLFL